MPRGMNKRTQKLREESVKAEPHISIERAVLLTEAYEKFAGTVETPILRALSFKHIMENKKLCILEGELIVGEKGEGPQSSPTYPELCCHTLDDMDVMNSRERIFFKVSEDARKIQEERIIPYWEHRSIRKRIFDYVTLEWKACYENGIFTEFMEQRSPGHTVADEKIYETGFLDFIERIDQEIDNLDFFNDKEDLNSKAQLKAMNIT